MSSPINQVTSGMHSFIDRPERTVGPSGVRYRTLPLQVAEFYGAHSNVMSVSFVRGARRVDWALYRTKDEAMPPAPVMTGRFPL
jgi:hypothetical protein